MLFEQQNRKLKTIMFVPAPHGPETGLWKVQSSANQFETISAEIGWVSFAQRLKSAMYGRS